MGGSTPNPTFTKMGDHTGIIQVDFDPSRITYDQLLNVFWASHNPSFNARTKENMPVVFYHTPEQRRLAEASKSKKSLSTNRTIRTKVLPATEFHLAEKRHQKFRLRRVPSLEWEFKWMYPDYNDFLNSTAVARVNGYLGGKGTKSRLQREIGLLGLSEKSQKELWRIFNQKKTSSR